MNHKIKNLLFFLFCVGVIGAFIYKRIVKNENKIDFGAIQWIGPKHPKQDALNALVNRLKTYRVFDEKGEIPLIRIGSSGDGGYLVSVRALEKASALMGYGIDQDISFEEGFSKKYHKPSYGFDCGRVRFQAKTDLFHFVPECIGTDQFLYHKESSNKKITSFGEQLKNLQLEHQSVFIKMDIEGAEFEAFPDILKHEKNITGMVFELHTDGDFKNIEKGLKLLSDIQKYFYLVHIHGNNCCSEYFVTDSVTAPISRVMELTYIHRSLVSRAELNAEQRYPKPADRRNCSGKQEIPFEILFPKNL